MRARGRVVHQDVDAAVGLLGPGGEVLAILGPAGVTGHGQRSPPRLRGSPRPRPPRPSSLRLARTTRAPAADRAPAIAAPIPREAPVTTATCPVRSFGFVCMASKIS